ncbi:hypothetical protein GHT06_010016 [Daphnia sinensis]|uniref:Uncharacterized protein n=1 Tax=Daphnia sinensis TaxID=1820382 RepID=A0AAD5LRD3_9CRUS|nr:hypothetical protein GHT06_010016 [Daphnia sinensis]
MADHFSFKWEESETDAIRGRTVAAVVSGMEGKKKKKIADYDSREMKREKKRGQLLWRRSLVNTHTHGREIRRAAFLLHCRHTAIDTLGSGDARRRLLCKGGLRRAFRRLFDDVNRIKWLLSFFIGFDF